jgi:hypothetical protein
MIVYAVVNDEYGTDGIPALFLREEDAQAYALELNGNDVESETYIVCTAQVQGGEDDYYEVP